MNQENIDRLKKIEEEIASIKTKRYLEISRLETEKNKIQNLCDHNYADGKTAIVHTFFHDNCNICHSTID